MYVAAYVTGESSNFAHVRNDFPYLGRVVRLIGPMQPTAKMFGAYLLFLLLLLVLGKELFSKRVWWLTLALLVACSLLTLGRVGLCAAVAAMLSIVAMTKLKGQILALAFFPTLLLALLVQVLTIWHFEGASTSLACDKAYQITEQTQYFGWYGKPAMCDVVCAIRYYVQLLLFNENGCI